MDISLLKRNPIKAKANLKTVNNSIVTSKDCIVQVPERYVQKNLAMIGTQVYVCGIFPIIFEEQYYTLNNTLAMFRMKPAIVEKIKIGDDAYYNLKFEAGDTLIQSTDLVVNNQLVYHVYESFIQQGNIPWFMDLFDVVNIFASAKDHAGVDLGNKTVMDIIVMTMARDSKDVFKLYKHDIKDLNYIEQNPPALIAFDSVIWNTSDTTSKLNGSYHNDAINAALVNKSERVELIEELLRT